MTITHPHSFAFSYCKVNMRYLHENSYGMFSCRLKTFPMEVEVARRISNSLPKLLKPYPAWNPTSGLPVEWVPLTACSSIRLSDRLILLWFSPAMWCIKTKFSGLEIVIRVNHVLRCCDWSKEQSSICGKLTFRMQKDFVPNDAVKKYDEQTSEQWAREN